MPSFASCHQTLKPEFPCLAMNLPRINGVWESRNPELSMQLPMPSHKHSAKANIHLGNSAPLYRKAVSAHAYETLVVLSALRFIGGGGGGGFFALDGGGGGACFLPFGADVSVE